MSLQNAYTLLDELGLGQRDESGHYADNVPLADQQRQRAEVVEILNRLKQQPGVILADEVGMGKTFIALAVACCIAKQTNRGPVIVMTPSGLLDKWTGDLKTFCELYLRGQSVVDKTNPATTLEDLRRHRTLRFGTARNSVELLKLMDDKTREQCHLVFMTQTAMSRQQSDKWVRLALIREALRRHGRGRAAKLIEVKKVIHRFMGDLLQAIGEQSAHNWGEELWQHLLQTEPGTWMATYNANATKNHLNDDPVPQAVVDTLANESFNLKPLAIVLEQMPLRDSSNRKSRIVDIRRELADIEKSLWKDILAQAKWRSPLLVIDEAHHLKNPSSGLAQQLQSQHDNERVLKTGHGAMANAFDRMLFLTATPFELGHLELIRVLTRFGDTRWHHASSMDMTRPKFEELIGELQQSLNEVQRSAIALQKSWSLLPAEEHAPDDDIDGWWEHLQCKDESERTPHQEALVGAFNDAKSWHVKAQEKLRPWIVRHNKGEFWAGALIPPNASKIRRRRKLTGNLNTTIAPATGIDVPRDQLLPFFLAARSDVAPGKDLLSEALCSSYEAFRDTRDNHRASKDEQDATDNDLSHSTWYLNEFDTSMKQVGGAVHPKVAATVQLAADLWEAGEKVLVFAFYRHTCAALRRHISDELQRRTMSLARQRFHAAGEVIQDEEINARLARIHDRYFDSPRNREWQALQNALQAILKRRRNESSGGNISDDQAERLVAIMRRFLRVRTTLVRCFPIDQYESMEPHHAVRSTLDREDGSEQSWRRKFESFIDFLSHRCASDERKEIIDALENISTRDIRVSIDNSGDNVGDAHETDEEAVMTLANVQVATGETKRDQRARQMRAFNTPFSPDIFVCSQVMSEGVDLHRYCRHVIHHDLTWNPSHIEQRTGRVDRLGCKAENEHPIHVYLPYIAGASDERQFRVMSDREQWFRVVMGQDEVARLIPDDKEAENRPLPTSFLREMSFDLAVC